MENIIIILLIGLLGRIWGWGELSISLGKINIVKPLSAVLIGLLFLPNIKFAACIAVGYYIGQLLRDSIFELLTGWNSRSAIRMTFRALAFLPLTLGVYYIMHGLNVHWSLPLVLVPTLSRAPVQYLIGMTKIPIGISPKKSRFVRLFWGKPAVYELAWNTVIGATLVFLSSYRIF